MPEIVCSVVQDLLEAYLAGEVSEETTAILAEHLSECPQCKRVVNLRETARSKLKKLPRLEVGDSHERVIVSRARRRLWINISMVLVIMAAFVAIGLREIYAHSVVAPVRVQTPQEFVEKTVPGAKLARALGLAIDYNLRINDWLTVDSVYRLDNDLAAVVYTTSNGLKLNDIWSTGSTTYIWRPIWFTQGSGAVSSRGHHFVAVLPLPYLGEQNIVRVSPSVNTPYRAQRILGQWTLRPQRVTGLPVTVGLELTKEFVSAKPSLTFSLDQMTEVLGFTLTFKELEVSSGQTRLSARLQQPPGGALGLSLQLVESNGNRVRLNGEEIRRYHDYVDIDYLFGPLLEGPGSLSIMITHAHLEQLDQLNTLELNQEITVR